MVVFKIGFYLLCSANIDNWNQMLHHSYVSACLSGTLYVRWQYIAIEDIGANQIKISQKKIAKFYGVPEKNRPMAIDINVPSISLKTMWK